MMTLSRLNVFYYEFKHFLLPVSLNHGQAFKKFGIEGNANQKA